MMKIKPCHAVLFFILLSSLCIGKGADEKEANTTFATTNATNLSAENASTEINKTGNKTEQINAGNISSGLYHVSVNSQSEEEIANASMNATSEILASENMSMAKNEKTRTCKRNEIFRENRCIPKIFLGAINRTLNYTLRGVRDSITITVYLGLADYLSKLPKVYSCIPRCPSDREIELIFMDNEIQKKHLRELVEKIKEKAKNKDDAARIGISIVQNLAYDDSAFINNNLGRYPYEVLYDMRGSCEEKSRLLAFLLRELGFGVAFFDFEKENHMAIGIKCPPQHSYRKTGYCFIETSAPLIITDAYESYGDVYLTSEPEVIVVSSGNSFESVYEEYGDALKLLEIKRRINGKAAGREDYNELESLIRKYGLNESDLNINISIGNV